MKFHNFIILPRPRELAAGLNFCVLITPNSLPFNFPALSVHSLVSGVETAVTPGGPLGRRLAHVVLRLPVTVRTALFQQLEEALVVDARVPLAVNIEAFTGEQDAAAVGMFRRDAVLETLLIEPLLQRLNELRYFPVEGNVGHAQASVGRRRGAAVRDTLDLDEAGQTLLHELSVALDLVVNVEALDQGQAEDGAVLKALLPQDIQTPLKALPEVPMQGAVDLAEGLLVRGIDRDVQLRHGLEGGELVRVLGVADEERGNSLGVEHAEELIDVRVKDGLADEGEGAMPDTHGLGEPLGTNTGNSA
ncbi:hypothetical protein CI238_05560 [Colletotrichum incanum]|uniref:Uncharacterized protein n=1 Tax=Colletotrichum incanum TaxID=1573173 RepID=A0A162PXI5_COLIC|nr:hypothetical protein CI238_05560 [Colletotrichum incanum]